MSAPTPEQVRVAVDALRAEAQRWAEQSHALAGAAAQAAALDMTRLEAGPFQIIVSAYQQAQAHVAGRLDEGRRVASRVADTLHTVADTYEREEAANTHRFRGLY